ncbi:unnamed protein product, partial [Aureobasidium uvarum]
MTFEHGADVAGPSGGDDKSVYKTNSEEVFVSGSGDHDAVYGVGGVGHTHRRLKARHVTFIGFGGGIGTGLFVGTGSALASAGPLGLLLAYSVVGLILWCVMESVGEIATLVVSAAAVVVSYWTDITPAVVITVGLAAILAINLMNVRFFGEAEVITASIKILCFLGLVIVSIVITSGGAPDHESIGFRYWRHPGPFTDYNGIKGNTGHFLAFFSAFINASFSYIGVETVIVAAAETMNPHKAIPKAVHRVTYRILFFYVLGTLLIGMIVPSNDPDLVSGSGNANSSPWVIAIKNSGITVLPSIVNACILVSAWSAGNSYCYIGSRMLVALAADRQMPQFFAKVNRQGVPYWAVLASFAFGPLAYLSLGSGGASQAFTWLLNLSTVAGLLAWMTLCICYIRYHHACKAQNIDRNALPMKGRLQPLAAYVGAIGSGIITIFSGFSVFLKGNWDTGSFFASYIGIAIYIIPYVVWKIVKRTRIARASEIDLWSGRFDPRGAVKEKEPVTKWEKFLDWLL